MIYMYHTKDTSTKFCYKFATRTLYSVAATTLKDFAEKYKESSQKIRSSAYFFHDFSVQVTPRFGELLFNKGNTEDNSSSISNISDGEQSNGAEQQQSEEEDKKQEDPKYNGQNAEDSNQPIEISAFADDQPEEKA